MQGAGANLVMSNRRVDTRWKVFEVALLRARGGASVCVIDNLSATGAMVSVDIVLETGEDVIFEVEEVGEIPARVMHRQTTLYGLMFKLDEIDDAAVRDWLAEVEKEGEA